MLIRTEALHILQFCRHLAHNPKQKAVDKEELVTETNLNEMDEIKEIENTTDGTKSGYLEKDMGLRFKLKKKSKL